MKAVPFMIAMCLCVIPAVANAQFNSGSTGADGPLDTSTMTCPGNLCTVQLPESGVLNYTTVNVSAGKVLSFALNSQNNPVTILAQGAVTISGQISINAAGRVSGSGGFFGGNGCENGFGPGGGTFGGSASSGKWVGSLSLVPIVGGSGGAGWINCSQPGGGGGGGIVIASSSNITAASGSAVTADGAWLGGSIPPGSGGAIRLVGNSLSIAGTLDACGNQVQFCGAIRLEAPSGAISFTGTATPTPVFATINPVIVPTNPPTLRIVSIGGYAVPDGSAGRPDRVDLMLPTQLSDPIQIQIQGSNVPSGTQVQLQLSSSSGTATGCPLTGGPGPVSCNASVSGLNRSGVSTLLAVATFTPPSNAQAFNPNGQNQVVKVRLETGLNTQSRFIFLRNDGTTIDPKGLSRQFLQHFGM